MKNAFVTADHHGDDGTVREGMILKDVTSKRFDALEKLGLVREATEAEVKAGYQPAVEGDPTKKKAAEPENKQAAAPANKAA